MQLKTYPRGTTLTAIAAPDDDLHPPSPLGIRATFLFRAQWYVDASVAVCKDSKSPSLLHSSFSRRSAAEICYTANLGPRGSVTQKLALD